MPSKTKHKKHLPHNWGLILSCCDFRFITISKQSIVHWTGPCNPQRGTYIATQLWLPMLANNVSSFPDRVQFFYVARYTELQGPIHGWVHQSALSGHSLKSIVHFLFCCCCGVLLVQVHKHRPFNTDSVLVVGQLQQCGETTK